MHLPQRFDDIAAEDVQRLVTEKTAECKTLEYKAALTINTQDEKAEFLSDISSFANASGGEILFGITDERDGNSATGVPGKIVGLKLDTTASECNRVEQLIRDGIQPRLPALQVKAIEIPESGPIIVIRVGKSWISPHMVSYANRTRFFSRSSMGKVQLDVQQIGAAFAEQRAIGERLRNWKADRISKAVSGTGPVELHGSRLLFHFIPASAIAEDVVALPRVFDQNDLQSTPNLLMNLSTESKRYNADGLLFVSYMAKQNKQSYLQVFKTGALEYGDNYVLNWDNDSSTIPGAVFEETIVETFQNALRLLSMLNASEPVHTTLTLIGVKGRDMAQRRVPVNFNNFSHSFDRDVVFTPDVQIRDTSETRPFVETLLPIVNSVWQAAGKEKSPFIENGQWQVGNQNQRV